MSDDLKESIAMLSQRVAVMDQKLETVGQKADDTNRNQTLLIKELHELSGAIREMVQKQNHVKETADRMWDQYEELSVRVRHLESFRDTNAPVIDAVRGLGNKVIGLVVAALLAAVIAPVATVTYILERLPEPKAVIPYEQARPTQRDKEQQSR